MKSTMQNSAENAVTSGSSAYRRRLWLILVFAAVIRIGYAVVGYAIHRSSDVFMSPDSVTYMGSAQSLYSGLGFQFNGEPDLNRTPGYPVALLPGFALGNVVLWAICMQVVVSCLCIGVITKIVGLIGGSDRIKLVAAFLYALEPLSVSYTPLVLTETLATFIVLISVYHVVRVLLDGPAWHAIAAGLWIGVLIYFRPFAMLFIPAIGGFLVLVALLRRRFRLVGMALALCCAIGFVVAPWLIRNRRLGYAGMSINPSFTIYFLTAASIVANEEGRPLEDVQHEWGYFGNADYFRNFPEQINWPTSRRYDFMHDRAMKIIKAHPIRLIYLQVRGMLKVLISPGAGPFDLLLKLHPTEAMDEKARQAITLNPLIGTILYRGLQAILSLYLFSVLALATIGVVKKARPSLYAFGYIVFMVLLIAGVCGGDAGYSRYRHPCMPLLVICAAFGAVYLWEARRKPIT
jgi:4-amino-4-deoxy-L-arabinose transferase-like glycosyltransferase